MRIPRAYTVEEERVMQSSESAYFHWRAIGLTHYTSMMMATARWGLTEEVRSAALKHVETHTNKKESDLV